MKVNKIEYKQKIYNHSIDDVFSFFSKPENLSKITPSRLGFYIKTPSPIVMKSGQLIDYIIKIVGLPIHWRTLITEYQSPHLFVDQQIKGPYSLWHHKHLFKEIENDLNIKNHNGDLLKWAKQGVLMLNSSLTVRKNMPGSHQNKGWEIFTDKIISLLSRLL